MKSLKFGRRNRPIRGSEAKECLTEKLTPNHFRTKRHIQFASALLSFRKAAVDLRKPLAARDVEEFFNILNEAVPASRHDRRLQAWRIRQVSRAVSTSL